ncbi:MAG: hypothetical protein ACE366_09295 [Bradymonadia bacterium]
MAKKKEPGKNSGESTDAIIDELAKDVGAEEESQESGSKKDGDESNPYLAKEDGKGYGKDDSEDDKEESVVPAEEGRVALEKGGAKGKKGGDKGASKPAENGGRKPFNAWPVDPDHESVTDMLMGAGGDPEAVKDFVNDEELTSGGGIINLLLFILVIGAIGGGAYALQKVSSPEAIAAKKAEREAIEKKHLEEQLAKQKKYGILRIESNPEQAVIFKNGEKIITKDPETQEEIVAKTPTNMLDMDIGQTYKFRLELEGYEPYEFSVAEHIWTKDDTTGDYKLARIIDLVPINCEYYFLYDAKAKREKKFEDKGACALYHDEAVAKGNQVTDCVCKVPPEGAEPKKEEEKK